MRAQCLNAVYELAKEDPRVVFIGSDLTAGVLKKFQDEMPERFYMEGISEALLIGMSAGLALEGNVVYVNTIGTFITRRCFEQIAVDVCLHNLNVRLISSGGGLVYAPLGPTHLAIEDISICRALPNMTVVAVADEEEMIRFMPETLEHQGPIYIRLGKGDEPVVTDPGVPFRIGKAIPMREGNDALILTTGIALKRVQDAAARLSSQGIECGILHVPTVKPFDEEQFLHLAARVPVIVSVEENTILGGFGGAVAEVIAEAGFSPGKKFRRVGIPDVFANHYGTQDDLMDYYGISEQGVVCAVQELVGA